MEKLGISLGYLIFQILNFTVMVVLLAAWAYKPIVNMLEKRRDKIAKGLEDARVAGEARANAEQEAARIISEAQSKANQSVREAAERALEATREVKAAADADIAKEREEALGEVQLERERILGEVRGQVASLSIAAAQKLIGEALDERRQHALINEFFSGVRAGKVAVLENESVLTGASADVTSALPLTVEEKEIVRQDILSKMGNQTEVNFKVDPDILGGLIIRAGGKVLNASVYSQLESLRQNLI